MKQLQPREAHAYLKDNPEALFIDCRSEMEFLFVGHPQGATHVPWNDGPDWEVNPHFVADVKKLAGNGLERPVVVICRSGQRSSVAGEALEAAGFLEVVNVVHGFEGELDDQHHRSSRSGWRFDGLPWEQS